MSIGVSIVICCHNSATRLPTTLAHLVRQEVEADLPWEVIVVDNASTDETRVAALAAWDNSLRAPLRVVPEPRLGVIHARERGFAQAQYEAVSFIDDDNWVAPTWVSLVAETIAAHPSVAAFGGHSTPAFESEPPAWFASQQGNYAIGPDNLEAGDVTETRGYLWGAGLVVRRSAWMGLIEAGFRPFLSGRSGNRLLAGEDSEICYALSLAGWRLRYEPRLRFVHFIPAHRLRWRYVRRMHRGFGESSTAADPYRFLLWKNSGSQKPWLGRIWLRNATAVAARLVRKHRRTLSRGIWREQEGNLDVLRVEFLLGRLRQLLSERDRYDARLAEVRNAPWRNIHRAQTETAP
jgi:glycosyltransferase involved in cell wall biosynthesis